MQTVETSMATFWPVYSPVGREVHVQKEQDAPLQYFKACLSKLEAELTAHDLNEKSALAWYEANKVKEEAAKVEPIMEQVPLTTFQVVEYKGQKGIIRILGTFRSLIDAQVYCSMANEDSGMTPRYRFNANHEFRVFNPVGVCFE